MGWTPETVKTLQHLWHLDMSCEEIACRAGVTKNAVIGKARRLGLARKRVRHGSWTRHDDAALRADFTAGLRDRELTKKFARSARAIKHRRRQLGLLHEKRGSHIWTTAREKRLRELWMFDVRIAAIAAEFGCSGSTVSCAASRLDLPSRKLGRPRFAFTNGDGPRGLSAGR